MCYQTKSKKPETFIIGYKLMLKRFMLQSAVQQKFNCFGGIYNKLQLDFATDVFTAKYNIFCY